jgi:hypothetical protein
MKKILCFFLLSVMWAQFSRAGVVVVGELTHEKTLEPGQRIEGSIELRNTGESECQVRVYQTDYLFRADGSNLYGDPGSADRSNAGWFSISPNRLTIPPHQKALVYYSGQVPQVQQLASVNNDLQMSVGAGPAGTYWSMVMIEPVPEAGVQTAEDEAGKVKLGIQTKVRYGIQIVTNVGDGGAPEIKFLDKKLSHRQNKTVLQMDIENTGERWLSPRVWVELYDSQGAQAGRFEGEKKRIYPGCSVRQMVDLGDVPRGRYKALVVVDNGDQYVFGARYDIGIE